MEDLGEIIGAEDESSISPRAFVEQLVRRKDESVPVSLIALSAITTVPKMRLYLQGSESKIRQSMGDKQRVSVLTGRTPLEIAFYSIQSAAEMAPELVPPVEERLVLWHKTMQELEAEKRDPLVDLVSK